MESLRMSKHQSIDKPDFCVTISPNRSLTATGLAILLGSIAALNLTGGIIFWYVGAWPVVGFMGLDVLLVWLAFRWNNRQALRSETVTITASELEFSRFFRGRLLERLVFPRTFVHVHIEHDDERELLGRLLLRSKGRAYELGSFLGAEERLALAHALEKALAKPKI
jgi:uncharacterized membrane protein